MGKESKKGFIIFTNEEDELIREQKEIEGFLPIDREPYAIVFDSYSLLIKDEDID